jgi:HEPN domain-containing protein
VNRADFQRLANERLADAKALLAAKRWTAAYYLAGYAVECGLKACIAKRTKPEEFPDRVFAEKCWTHHLPQLLGLAGLKPVLDADIAADPILLGNWETTKDWTEASRYSHKTKVDAENLFDAISDKKHGVFPWVKERW